MSACSDVLDFRTINGIDIYRSLASELQRSLLESLAKEPSTARELHRLHAHVSPATIARSLAQLTERGLIQRRGITLSLSAQASTIEVIRLARKSPGGLPTLRVLASPVARAILEALIANRRGRDQLSRLGPAPRVSDALRNLELLGCVERDGQIILLVDPTTHRRILDLVDQILVETHQRAYRQARSRLRERATAARG
jgi:DNA-binding Lrp family transcriptional regulator